MQCELWILSSSTIGIGKAKDGRPFNLVPAEAVIQEVWMFYLLIRCQVCCLLMVD